jgi:hypothetical protein
MYEYQTKCEPKISGYLWWPAKPKTDCTNESTLSSAVWTDDHVEVWTREEFGRGVCDEIRQFDTDDGAGLMPSRARGRVSLARQLWFAYRHRSADRPRCFFCRRVIIFRVERPPADAFAVIGCSGRGGVGSRILVIRVQRPRATSSSAGHGCRPAVGENRIDRATIGLRWKDVDGQGCNFRKNPGKDALRRALPKSRGLVTERSTLEGTKQNLS